MFSMRNISRAVLFRRGNFFCLGREGRNDNGGAGMTGEESRKLP
jgi:hypothetical protein